ncbi:unnamed protein product [Nippostrongylus brasiliensis]|uniref:Metalloendopeptidase n=1 Tax=Nippostrongylus brasiliensis TaxID=27835 RepID=A0A0N4YNQ0_NIPBR|nr:unnamed protein product [Nippostrongylus brasiliensis]
MTGTKQPNTLKALSNWRLKGLSLTITTGRESDQVKFGVTSHELAHTLGVFHEQSRYDRDPVVQLNSRVVAPELLFNFAKVNFYPELSSGC